MATLEISAWKQEDYSARTSGAGYEQRCSWGGTSCQATAEFTVVDRAGARNAACPDHLVTFVRDRVTSD